MTLFDGKPRQIAHRDWFDAAVNGWDTTVRLYRRRLFPKVIEFPMVVTPLHRMLRCCFKSRWHMLWYLFCSAYGSEIEKVHGVLYRFWRYRVQMKSQEADMHRIMTSLCPKCNERHEIPKISEDIYKCEGCGAQMDFGELVMAQPGEDGDDDE